MKVRLVVLPLLAVGGFAVTGLAVARFNQPPKTGPEPAAPAPILFGERVAGTALVEPASEVVQVGTPVGGIVTSILVAEGDRVDAGAPLAEIDPREAEARLEVARAQAAQAQASVAAARARIAQLEALPRAEDLAEARALVDARRAALVDAEGRLARLLAVPERGTTANEQPTLEFGVALANAQLAESEARLARVEAGTYPEDLAVAREELVGAERAATVARAQLGEAEVARERLVVRAPIAGTILKIETRTGEYRAAGPNAGALLRMGDVSSLHVRTDIDELDAWRFDATGKAVARIRGGSRMEVPLRFVRIVPDVAPKRTLTGENAERIDTRVLQVIYALENPPDFIRPGMLVDVAAEAKPAAGGGDAGR